MTMQCTATVIHTNLEIYWRAVVELFCKHSTDSLHFNNYVDSERCCNITVVLVVV